MCRFLLMTLLFAGAAIAETPDGPYTQEQCIECHGKKNPAVHSYQTSKHGVLVSLGTGSTGRAPDCVGCHTSNAHKSKDAEAMRQRCHHCHSPRYVETLNTNGARMIEVGQKKILEAQQLLSRARKEFSAEALEEMESHYVSMQKHMTNLRLGVGHQSPDYQWWHGHPALDGDLLRLKGAYDQLVRRKALTPPLSR